MVVNAVKGMYPQQINRLNSPLFKWIVVNCVEAKGWSECCCHVHCVCFKGETNIHKFDRQYFFYINRYIACVHTRNAPIYQQDNIYLLDFHLEHDMAMADVFIFFASHQSYAWYTCLKSVPCACMFCFTLSWIKIDLWFVVCKIFKWHLLLWSPWWEPGCTLCNVHIFLACYTTAASTPPEGTHLW